jgi:methionyl aminopeptidase
LHKFGVVRDLIGHGIGKSMHEEPDVPNHGKRGSGFLLRKNLVIAIEPMINMGTKDVRIMPDGWTILTKDGKPSAHFEHSVAVRAGKADILSDHSFIEEAEKNNENLLAVQTIK